MNISGSEVFVWFKGAKELPAGYQFSVNSTIN